MKSSRSISARLRGCGRSRFTGIGDSQGSEDTYERSGVYTDPENDDGAESPSDSPSTSDNSVHGDTEESSDDDRSTSSDDSSQLSSEESPSEESSSEDSADGYDDGGSSDSSEASTSSSDSDHNQESIVRMLIANASSLLLQLTASHLYRGWSDDVIKKSFAEQQRNNDQGSPKVTAFDELNFIQKLEGTLDFEELWKCQSCKFSLLSSTTPCGRRTCSLYRVPPRKDKGTAPLQYIRMNTRDQFVNILTKNFAEILRAHRSVHGRERGDLRDDCRDFGYWKSGLETKNEWRQRHIIVQVEVSSDGFTYSKLQRATESNPIYLRILDLPPSIRSKVRNVVFAGSTVSDHSLKSPEWTVALADLNEFILSTQHVPIYIRFDNKVFMISLSCTSVTMDCKGLSYAYNLPLNGKFGCYRCVTRGLHVAGSIRYLENGDPRQRGTSRSPTRNALTLDYGFRGPSPWNDVVPVYLCAVDGLHCWSEGVASVIRQAIWDKLDDTHKQKVIQTVQTARYPTHARTLLRVPGTKVTGSEGDMLSQVLVYLASSNIFDASWAIPSLAVMIAVRTLTSYPLTRQTCREVSKLLLQVHSPLVSLYGPGLVTIKGHLFFVHGASDLKRRCTFVEGSMAGFEAIHDRLREALGNSASRGAILRSLRRLVLLSLLSSEIELRASQGDVDALKCLDEIDNKSSRRAMKQAKPVNDHVKLCDADLIQSTSLVSLSDRESRDSLLQHGAVSFRSRSHVSGIVYTSSHWRDTTMSRSEVFTYLDDQGRVCFGKARLYGLKGDVVYASYDKFVITCPFQYDTTSLDVDNDYLQNFITKYNRFFFKVIDIDRNHVIDVKHFTGHATILKYDGQLYILNLTHCATPE